MQTFKAMQRHVPNVDDVDAWNLEKTRPFVLEACQDSLWDTSRTELFHLQLLAPSTAFDVLYGRGLVVCSA